MLGSMIKRIRTEKNMTKVELSKRTKINIGHITHIEKGERNPSHKALESICNALNVPFQLLAFLNDQPETKTNKNCDMVNHLSYNKVLVLDSYKTLIDCPTNVPSASIAIKYEHDDMEPTIEKNSYIFLELNVPLNSKDMGLFQIGENIIIRRFSAFKGKITLRADNNNYPNIILSKDDSFTIIGKIHTGK